MKKCKLSILLIVLALVIILPAAIAHAEQLVLKQGMSGDDVLKMQMKLQGAGYYSGGLDGSFGSGTRSAVMNFQADRGLEADGIAGPETLQALQGLNAKTASNDREGANSQNQVLKQGATGDDVLKLQAKLQGIGYYRGGLDGNFGPSTFNAVMSFQADRGLVADGIAGPDTLRALQVSNPSDTSPNRGQVGDRKAQAIVSFARRFLGTPYVWAGSSPSGFDCSGFTCYVFSQFGIDLPHAADGQYNTGVPVSQPGLGDLVFFTTYESGPSHVGIYIGNGQFIHASSGAGEVSITPLSKPYYSARYLGARRVLS